ncbi:hypothetical protein CHH91_15510 [Virgibacillus sp. 7505]|nr:hypothetical protein CHH91_15510 [Virgibacillus sp. 7505]
MKRLWDNLPKYSFPVLIILYLIQRDYPFGGTFQTITDIVLSLTLILVAVNWIIDWKLKRLDE